jgi:outer membrane receptor for ferrienterochelin and colicins
LKKIYRCAIPQKSIFFQIGFLFIFVLSLLCPLVVCGDEESADLTELSIEELIKVKVGTVYGASKFEQKVTEAPSSISIVTADDIRKFGYRTLADILRSLMSFNISYLRDYSYVGVRGFGRPGDYNSRILLLVDGHRTNENIYETAYIGTEFILDMDLIDRVEVIRGPGSSLYGNNAFFAVINVITKHGSDLKGPEVSAEAGSFKTYKGRVSYGNKFRSGMDVIVSGTGYDSKGDNLYFKGFDPAYSSDPRAANNGIADHCDYDRYQSVFGKVSQLGLTVEGAYSSRTKGVPTAAYLTDFNETQSKYSDTRGYVHLEYERTLGNDMEIAANLFYDYYKFAADYPGKVVYEALNKSLAKGEWWGAEIELNWRLLDVHHFNVGMEYIDNFRKDHTNYDVDPYYVYDDNKKQSSIWSIHIQDEYRISRSLLLNAGIRYDHYSTFGGTLNPRIAMIYRPADKSAIKLIYGTAFRAPNDYEMLYTNITQAANPRLEPEKIKTYELVYEQYVGDLFRISASGYYYKISGLIGSEETTPGSGITIYRNIGDVTAKGFELEMEKNWDSGVRGRANYTIQWTEDKQNGGRLTNSPQHLAKFNIMVPVMKEKIFVGIEEQYTSRRKTQAGNNASEFFITNLTLFSQNIVKHLELSVSAYNLFDKKYSDPGLEEPNPPYTVLDTIQQDGRTFRVKLTYRF